MKLKVKKLDGSAAGNIELDDAVFGLEPREDILQRVVRWQLSRRQSGNHKTKNRSEIAGTSKKTVRQKGSGGARHGNRKAPQFRGGGKAFGPLVRSHAHDLPKKVRMLGLKSALSAKVRDDALIVVDAALSADGKAKALRTQLDSLGLGRVLIIDTTVEEAFGRAARNLVNVDVLPVAGANVYDILNKDKLVLTKGAAEALQERFR